LRHKTHHTLVAVFEGTVGRAEEEARSRRPDGRSSNCASWGNDFTAPFYSQPAKQELGELPEPSMECNLHSAHSPFFAFLRRSREQSDKEGREQART
jgi:hypothetical protein